MLPTFIVIGAAKAGTTAVYWSLADHPQIYMSPMKETNFFAYGLDHDGGLLYGDRTLHRFRIRTLEAYEELFADAGNAVAIGEASPIYLECPQAASRIRARIPDATIVCGLRDPVDRAYSDYQMYLRSRGRPLLPERDLVPGARWAHPDSHWMRIGRYHEMLSRYYDVFPHDRIHVFLFDDLRSDPGAVVADVYRSVGVDPSFVPDLETPHNVGGMPGNVALERVLTSKVLRRAIEPFVPRRAADLARRLRTTNLRRAPRLPAAMAEEMAGCFREDVDATAQLIGRDLDAWVTPTQVSDRS